MDTDPQRQEEVQTTREGEIIGLAKPDNSRLRGNYVKEPATD